MTDPKASTANDSARCHGNAGLTVADCKFCMRQGLPILPVRYAVSLIEDTPDVTPLPADREAELYPLDKDGNPVPIKLDTVYEKDDQGNFQKKSGLKKVSKYILRIMRSGFLYVYDEGNAAWYAYAITDTGEFEQFSIADTDKQYKKKSQKFACDKKGTRASAKLITLDRVDTTKKAWFMYIESPISREFLRDVASTAEWREKNMQCFDVDAWLNSGKADYAFAQDKISDLLADYGNGKSQLKTCYYPFMLKGDETKLADIQAAINSRIDNNAFLQDKTGKGVMLAVKDETAIIEELNAYRQRPNKSKNQYLSIGKNPWRAQSAAAITSLRHSLEQQFSAYNDEKKDEDDEYLNNLTIAYYIQNRDILNKDQIADVISASEGKNDTLEKFLLHHVYLPHSVEDYSEKNIELSNALNKIINNNPGYNFVLGTRIDPSYYISIVNDNKTKVKSRENTKNRFFIEFNSYYHQNEIDKFLKEDLKPYDESIKEDCPRRDGDYSLWINFGLLNAINRYDYLTPKYGVKVSEIVQAMLEGNIISSSSEWLWGGILDNLNSDESVIVKAFFANLKPAVDEYIKNNNNLNKDENFFNISNLKQLNKILKNLYTISKDKWDIPDINLLKKYTFNTGKNLVAASSSIMAFDKSNHALKAEEFIPRTDRICGVIKLIQVNSLIIDGDKVDFESKISMIHEVDGVTLNEYHKYIRYISNPNGAEVLREDTFFKSKFKEGSSTAISGTRPIYDIEGNIRARAFFQVKGDSYTEFHDGLKEKNLSGLLPEKVHLIDSSVLDNEMKKAHGRLWGTANIFGLIDVLLSSLSLWETWKLYNKEEGKEEVFNKQLWPLFVSFVGAASAVLSLGDSVINARGITPIGEVKLFKNIKLAWTNAENESASKRVGKVLFSDIDSALGQNVLKVGAKSFGFAANILGVISGFQALAEAETMQRKGAMQSQVLGKSISGGLLIIGSVISLACGSLVLAPLAMAILTLIIAFGMIQLVDHNVRTWLRRSFFGAEQKNVMGGKFKTPEQEANSLNMVFQGIDVVVLKDITRGTKWLKYFSMGSADGYNYYDAAYGDHAVNLSVSVSNKIRGLIGIKVIYYTVDNNQEGFNYYINIKDNKIKVLPEKNIDISRSGKLIDFDKKNDNDPKLSTENDKLNFFMYRNSSARIEYGVLTLLYLECKKDIKDINNLNDYEEKNKDVYEF